MSSATVPVRSVDPQAVAAARRGLPGDDLVGDLAADFAVLGEPGRVRLLAALLHAGELCVGDLAAVVGMTESATSHALRLLRARRIVRVRRAGRMAYYSLQDEHVRTLLTTALQHAGHTNG